MRSLFAQLIIGSLLAASAAQLPLAQPSAIAQSSSSDAFHRVVSPAQTDDSLPDGVAGDTSGEAHADVNPGPAHDPAPEPGPGPGTDSGADTDSGSSTDPGPSTGADSDPAPEPSTDPDLDPDQDTDPAPDPDPAEPVAPLEFKSSRGTIVGAPVLGTTLTVKPGTWTPAPSFNYQWQRLKDGIRTDIAKATAASYVPVKSDLGHRLVVRVTASADGYTERSIESAPTTVVLNKIINTVRPTLTGTSKAGKTIAVKTGTWTPAKAKLTLQWQRDGKAIKGATKSSYKLTTADRSHKITVKVTASISGYATTTATSTTKTVLAVLKQGTPKITGSSAKAGLKVTAQPGSWTNGSTFKYQWYRDGKAISGATKATYKVVAADQCRALTVKVTGQKATYESASKTSAKRNLVGCAEASGDKIRVGQRIAPGKRILSTNKAHYVKTEKSGNMYLYNHGRQRFGAIGTAQGQLVLYSDGNLVLRNKGKAQWSSRTAGKGVAYGQVLSNGDFGLFTSSGKQVWAVSSAWQYRGNNSGVPRFSQNDGRWAHQRIGGRVFGPVGCVPTAFAMVAQSYGVWVDPGSVGRVMHQKGDFNHAQAGAGSKSIVAAAKHYGMMATPLHSWNAVADALASKRPVIALVRGPAQITSPGSTHAVVLSGYSGGATTVTNPWGNIPNQRWSVSTLWAWQSHDRLDRNAGAVFWAMG